MVGDRGALIENDMELASLDETVEQLELEILFVIVWDVSGAGAGTVVWTGAGAGDCGKATHLRNVENMAVEVDETDEEDEEEVETGVDVATVSVAVFNNDDGVNAVAHDDDGDDSVAPTPTPDGTYNG